MMTRKEVYCTKEKPWNNVHLKNVRVVHVDAEEVGQRDYYDGGDYVDYKCPHCGYKFSVELPQ